MPQTSRNPHPRPENASADSQPAAVSSFEASKRAHLERLVGDSGKSLVERWLTTYFERQSEHPDIEEFRFHLEAALEDYVGYFSAPDDRLYDMAERSRIGEVAKRYHEMFYEGQADPYAPETPEASERRDAVVKKVGARARIARLLGWGSE